MGNDRYQRAKVDGHADWTNGQGTWPAFWENLYDDLRMHRGAGYRVIEKVGGEPGPNRTIKELEDLVHERLDKLPPDSVLKLLSSRDDWSIVVRRHVVEVAKGALIIQNALEWLGDPYSLGYKDCSGLTAHAYGDEGIELPHKAGIAPSVMPSQLHDPQVLHIQRSEIEIGDLLFHWGSSIACDHVSLYAGKTGPGNSERVFDTEPHGVAGPVGWGYIPPGAHYRPMQSRYYCDWEHVVAIGRVASINGRP